MQITKKDFEDISKLIMDSYLTEDVFLRNTYVTIRSVSRYESNKIIEKYKYINDFNFDFMLDTLSLAIIKIGGLEIHDNKLIRRKLACSHKRIVTFFYYHYTKLIKRINSFSEILDIYIETDESKNNWLIYKNFNNNLKIENINQINGFQRSWIILNLEKDNIEQQKNEWSKTSFMTNAICAFVNNKQYRQNKNSLNVMNQFDVYNTEIKENKRIAEDVNNFSEAEENGNTIFSKKGKAYLNKDQELFDNLNQKRDETKEQYHQRMEEALVKRLKGEVVDDHDKVIKNESIKKFIFILYEYRKKQEIANKIREMKREILDEEEEEIIGSDLDEKKINSDFYYNNVDYTDIINTKGLHLITKEEKKKIFDDIMKIQIDVDKEANDYIKKIQQEKFKLNKQNEDLDSIGFMPLTKE